MWTGCVCPVCVCVCVRFSVDANTDELEEWNFAGQEVRVCDGAVSAFFRIATEPVEHDTMAGAAELFISPCK